MPDAIDGVCVYGYSSFSLIKNSYNRTLLNTFCIKNEEEVSELNVNTIADYAFEGCEKADGFFADEHRKNACVPSIIYQHAFDSSAFLKLPFVDGFKHIAAMSVCVIFPVLYRILYSNDTMS